MEVAKLGSTKEIVKQSFIVSGGSNEAHALFIRGLALHLKMPPHEVSTILRRSVETYKTEDIKDLMKTMGEKHSGNQNAKDRTVQTLHAFKQFDTSDIISALIPADQTAFHVLLANNEDVYSQSVIDKALTRVWESSDETKRYSDLKAVNAELGAYKGLSWWEATPDEQKSVLIKRGQEILRTDQ